MGVEHFLDRYKEDGTATLDFTRMVSRGIEEESSRGHFKSTLSFIAEKFIRHGAIEIKGIEMEGGIQFAGTAETEEPNKNFGAVLMGNLIVEIENTLIDIRANKGVYNLYGFMERMKNDLGSLPPLKPDFQMTEKITKRKRKEMYEAATSAASTSKKDADQNLRKDGKRDTETGCGETEG